MAKPALTTLARQAWTNAFVVDVARGPNGSLVVSTAIDSPADLTPGRYAMRPVKDNEMAIKRLVTVEHEQMLAKVQKRTGIRPHRGSP